MRGRWRLSANTAGSEQNQDSTQSDRDPLSSHQVFATMLRALPQRARKPILSRMLTASSVQARAVGELYTRSCTPAGSMARPCKHRGSLPIALQMFLFL